MIASRDGALQRNGHIMNERYGSFDVVIRSMITNKALLEHIRRRGAVVYERRRER